MTIPDMPPSGPGWALFLDFDGTLVEIAERPDAVRVPPELPDLLRRLRDTCGGALAIVTGRPIADIDGFLPGLDLDACGKHGIERRVGMQPMPRPAFPDLSPEIGGLRRRLAGFPAVLIEDKTIGVAVHWRMQPEAEEVVRSAVADLAGRLGEGYRIQDGKAVREIVPAQAGKGDAIAALMAVPPYSGRRPVFVGDDLTDEAGFVAVDALGGVAVRIGMGVTVAHRRIAASSSLLDLLSAWPDGGAPPDVWGAPV